jgi:hypothetical protein
MNAPTALEDRIRRGLRDAAAAIPPADPQPQPRHRPQPSGRPRWTFRLAAGAAAMAAVVAAVVFVAGGDDEQTGEVEVGTPDEATPQQQEPPAIEHPVPGQAVVVGTELRTYDAAGAQTGTVDLAPLTDVQGISSDLTGGWVACGMSDRPPAAPSGDAGSGQTTTTVPSGGADPSGSWNDGEIVLESEERIEVPASESFRWFPADGEPVELPWGGLLCMADSVQVVDTPDGPTALYTSMSTGEMVGFGLGAVVLSTGEPREVALPAGVDPNGFYRWSATSNRIALYSVESGLVVFDWTTGQTVATPAIDLGDASDIKLSHDGTSIAAITGDDIAGPSDLVVYDLNTGAERFRETFPTLSLEGAQLAYDGTVVAVGSFYDQPDYPPVTVIDITTGARHTVDAHGLLP